MNGIHMLHGKNIYTILGNHNIEEPILQVQLGLSEWTIPNRYYCIQFKDYTLVAIDNNLINSDKYNDMLEWLINTINELKISKKHYFYIQHEPFISFKKNKKTVLPNISDLLYILTDYPPISILCADTHNFQKGVLCINDICIPQIIVGTGGANPDYVSVKSGTKYTIDNITYIMEEYIPGYGYLQITPKGVSFIKVEDWKPFEGIGGAKKIHLIRKHIHRIKTNIKKQISKKSTQKHIRKQYHSI
jgi:hypothetical protein